MAQTLIFTENLDAFEIDVTIEETHTNTLSITDYPVEKGTDISDHAQIEPKRFDIIAGVSNLLDTYQKGRVQAAFEILKAVQEKRQPFTIISGLTTLTNMLIENFTVTQDKDTANILLVRAHLKEVIIVGTQQSKISLRPQFTGGDFTLSDFEGQNKAAPIVERGDVSLPFGDIEWDNVLNATTPQELQRIDDFISKQEATKLIDLGAGGG